MKAVFVSMLISFLSFALSTAAPTDSIPLMHHAFGISGSSITGPGISYRYNFDNQYYIKSVGFLYYSESNELNSDLYAFAGLEFQTNFIRTQNSRLYGFAGTSYWFEKSVNSYISDNDTTISIYKDMIVNLGVGFGFEISIWEHFAANFDFGFQYTDVRYSNTSTDNYYRPHSRVGMGGGLGFSYQF